MGCKWHKASAKGQEYELPEALSANRNYDYSSSILKTLLDEDAFNKINKTRGWLDWSFDKNEIITLVEEMTLYVTQKSDSRVPKSDNLHVGLTYIGQLITHDIVSETEESAVPAGTIRRAEVTTSLNLDSIFGDIDQYDLRKGNEEIDENGIYRLTPVESDDPKRPGYVNQFDFPRINGVPRIPEQRNAENIIVSQLHIVFLLLHREAMKHLSLAGIDVKQKYIYAKNFVVLLFQNIVVEEYLKTVLNQEVFNQYFGKEGEETLYQNTGEKFVIPKEFSNAMFRFGHSMVRQLYPLGLGVEATRLDKLFQRNKALTKDLIIDWRLFFPIPIDGKIHAEMAGGIDLNLASGLKYLKTLQQLDNPAVSTEALFQQIESGKLIAPYNFRESRDYKIENLEKLRNFQNYNHMYKFDSTVLPIDQHKIIERDGVSVPRMRAAQGVPGDSIMVEDSEDISDQKQGFTNLVIKDLESSRQVPTGGDIVALLQKYKPSLLNWRRPDGGQITEGNLKRLEFDTAKIATADASAHLTTQPTGKILNLANSPLWIFSLKEAAEYQNSAGEYGDPDKVFTDRLGPVSSLIVAEVLRMSIKQADANIFSLYKNGVIDESEVRKAIGPLAGRFIALESEDADFTMENVFSLIINFEE